ncbi:MAG: hypothetical protein FJ290_30005 [Planctomycetes bacterium]|nr:hypothetical protein [Planctomycetota bacterium]
MPEWAYIAALAEERRGAGSGQMVLREAWMVRTADLRAMAWERVSTPVLDAIASDHVATWQ